MKRQLLFISALLGILMFVIIGSLQGTEIQVPASESKLFFNPKAQKPIVHKLDDGTELRTTGETEVPENFKNFEVIITRPGKQPVSVSIPNEIAQINSVVTVAGKKVALIGMVNGSVYEVVLIDVIRYRLADKFWAYSPEPSPDGRFIAFTKFYPAHGYSPPVYPEGASPSDFVMLYDTTLSPSGNRPAGVNIDNKIDVGTVIYPPGVKTQDDNTMLADADANHVSTLTWEQDSSKLVFSAEHQLKNAPKITKLVRGKTVEVPQTEASLVLVDLTFPRTPRVSVFQADVCVGLCVEPLMNVEFGASGLKAQLGLKPKQKTIEVRYDQFTSP